VAFIGQVAQVLEQMKIHPLFPYPIYIICDKVQSDTRVPVAPSLKELPRHFVRKINKLKSKEASLLNKDGVLAQKVSNLDIDEKMQILKRNAELSKQLYLICRELKFYESIQNALDRQLEERV